MQLRSIIAIPFTIQYQYSYIASYYQYYYWWFVHMGFGAYIANAIALTLENHIKSLAFL